MHNLNTVYAEKNAPVAYNVANKDCLVHLVSETEVESASSETARPSRIVDQITTETDKKFDLVARMADAIVETTLEMGDCVEQVLHAKGFALADTRALWHFANALAAVELKFRGNDADASLKQAAHYA